MITIVQRANEQGTMGFVCEFSDDDKQPVAPSQITWSLTDPKGEVINGLDKVAITPAQKVTIVLKGQDLQIRDAEATLAKVSRRLVVEILYSSTLGNDLPMNEVASFEVNKLVKVPG